MLFLLCGLFHKWLVMLYLIILEWLLKYQRLEIVITKTDLLADLIYLSEDSK